MQQADAGASGEAREIDPIYRAGDVMLVLLSLAACLALALANLRHNGSIAFPIDDGYIYSNYVEAAASGRFFTYGGDAPSGGVTGAGWYMLVTLTYLLLAPFHGLLGAVGGNGALADAGLSARAGHLYLAAYVPGALCLAGTALGTRRLSSLVLSAHTSGSAARAFTCILLGVAAATHAGLAWGAMSGLEVPLSSLLVVWTVYLLALEAPVGHLRWSLLTAALLPFARPDLLAIGGGGVLWLVLFAIVQRSGGYARMAAILALSLALGVAFMALVYFAGWGHPLPSSFYAKVGGLRLDGRFFAAAQELLIAGRMLPFIALAATLAGTVLAWLRPGDGTRASRDARSKRALLLLVSIVVYVAGIMATLPWFGQEDRYLLPLYPLVIVGVGTLLWGLVLRISPTLSIARVRLAATLLLVLSAAAIAGDYLWATRNYVVHARNIRDGHILPARWLAANTPLGTVVAAEPIGAVTLFSERSTLDLVGLTTPVTLGTYGDWPVALRAMQAAGAGYLLFYPEWFDERSAPPWAVERRVFSIPDNRIVGDDVIGIYELDYGQVPVR